MFNLFVDLPFYYADWFGYVSIGVGALLAIGLGFVLPFFLLRKKVNNNITPIKVSDTGAYIVPDDLRTSISKIVKEDGFLYVKKAGGAIRADFAFIFENENGRKVVCRYHIAFEDKEYLKITFPKGYHKFYQAVAIDQQGKALNGERIDYIQTKSIVLSSVLAGVGCLLCCLLGVFNLSTHLTHYEPAFINWYFLCAIALVLAPIAFGAYKITTVIMEKRGK